MHKLISVDAAPIPRTLSQSVVPEYLMAMKDLNFDLSDSLSEVKRSAGNQLQKSIPVSFLFQFVGNGGCFFLLFSVASALIPALKSNK